MSFLKKKFLALLAAKMISLILHARHDDLLVFKKKTHHQMKHCVKV